MSQPLHRVQNTTTLECYQHVEAFYTNVHKPGFGRPFTALEISASPVDNTVLCTGLTLSKLEGGASLALFEVAESGLKPVSGAGSNAMGSTFSPDGKKIAFLSDRGHPGEFQAHIIERGMHREAMPLAKLDGTIEKLFWSGDDHPKLFAIVAEPGADQASAQGGKVLSSECTEGWRPKRTSSEIELGWRQVYELKLDGIHASPLSPKGLTVWHACAYQTGLIALVSSDPSERGWYSARLVLLQSGRVEELYMPTHQIGPFRVTRDQKKLVFIEAPASDRDVIAGHVKVLDISTGHVRTVDLPDVDVSALAERPDGEFVLAGLSGHDTVLFVSDPDFATFSEIARERDWTCGLMQPEFELDYNGDVILQKEGYRLPPELCRMTSDGISTLWSFRHAGSDHLLSECGVMEPILWSAPDGTQIHGWLARPEESKGPLPIVMDVHGGPIWSMRPMWLGRSRLDTALCVQRGYGVFFPNMRGSTGQGIDFQTEIVGGMGECELADFTSGVDYLVENGIADPDRIAIVGGSYGGYMACLLPTYDSRYKAAVATSPVTFWPSFHRLSNISHFAEIYLASEPDQRGVYFARSPAIRAKQNKTPTLQLGGQADKCTPMEQIILQASALTEAGTPNAYALYPGEGHGIRTYPAILDACSRTLDWIDRHFSGVSS